MNKITKQLKPIKEINLKPILDYCKQNNLEFVEEYDRDSFRTVLKIYLTPEV